MAQLKKLLEQQKKLEEQIKVAGLAERHRVRVEKMIAKLVPKYPTLFGLDPAVLSAELDKALASIAENATKAEA